MRDAFLILFLLFSPTLTQAQEDVSDSGAEDQATIEWVDSLANPKEEDVLGEEDYTVDSDETNADYFHDLVPPEDLETTRTYQSENLALRKFDREKWKEIVGTTDFKEDASRETEEEKESEEEGNSIPWGGPLLKMISYVVIIGVVLWLLYLVINNTSFDLKIKRVELKTDEIENGVENIEDVDIQTLLEQARMEGNFRMAVRLYYLGLLKKLHGVNAIAWKKEKTNRDYLSELFAKDFYFEDVRRLTNSYEAVWYGEHTLQPETFQRLSAQFETVYQKMNKPEGT